MQVYLGGKSRFKLQATFDVSKHPVLTIAWISSLSIMALRVVRASVKSAPVGLLNKPKIFFKATSFDHSLVCLKAPRRFTVVECRRQMFIH